MSRIAMEVFATWFYVGRLRPAPGTLATVAAIPLVYGLMQLGALAHMSFAVVLTLVSFTVIDFYERWSGQHDPKEVVIDEVIGFTIAMTWLPITWQSFLFGFLFFRVLDIVKPYPISWMDQNIRGGVGVVADDVAAGLITNFVLQVVGFNTMWLGERLQ